MAHHKHQLVSQRVSMVNKIEMKEGVDLQNITLQEEQALVWWGGRGGGGVEWQQGITDGEISSGLVRGQEEGRIKTAIAKF